MTTSGIIHPELYYRYFDKEGVTNGWLLVSSPLPVLSALVVYLSFVLHLGPKYMKHRRPFQLQGLMKLYNILQVAYNGWMLYLILSSSDAMTYIRDRSCHPQNPMDNFNTRYIFHLHSWHYLCSKYFDLLDTFIMVLRKKQSQITYLHVYHHSIMVILIWGSMKYLKAQQIIVPLFLNNFIHVIMYTYYFLACFGPEVQKFLWWKRYLTRLQLAQFATMNTFLSYLYFNKCEVSQTFNIIWIANVSIFTAFFINFYIQTYVSKLRTSSKKQG